MKNIFLKSKAKSLQKTGGGDSQKNVHHLGVASEMPPRCLRDASVSIYSCQSDFSTRVWKYAAMLLMVLTLGVGQMWGADGTAIANLNFSNPSTLPSAFTYSSDTPPTKATAGVTSEDEDNREAITLGSGGGTAPTSFSATDAAAPSGGKRWIAFQPAEDCTVTISVGIVNNGRTFYLLDKDHKTTSDYVSSYAPAQRYQWYDDWEVSLTAGTWYAIVGNGSNCFIHAMQFTASSGGGCTADPAVPTKFEASSITDEGVTFSITDAANASSYDIYYSTSSATPEATATVTATSTAKTKAITGLTASTQYYAWVRSVCDASHKSAWVALEGGSFTTAAIGADLTAHTPGLYEKAADKGGYGQTLVTKTVDSKERQFEIYGLVKSSDDAWWFAGTKSSNTSDAHCISSAKFNASTPFTPSMIKGAWMKGSIYGMGSNMSSANAEFPAISSYGPIRLYTAADYVMIKVQGYDQISFYAKDKNSTASNNKHLVVKINGEEQSMSLNTSYSVRRFTLTPSAVSVIEISGSTVSDENLLAAFSLRLPACTEPTTTFANGEYTVGGSALDLSTLIGNNNSSGAITYEVKNANGTGASISTASFTATTAGTCTVTATQAADGGKCEKVIDATITISVPSCDATVPGDISKGDLTDGSITLTAAGSAETGDVWYWQSSATGEDKTGTSGATKTVNAAGTYYIRSYNESGNCWSAAKSVELTAEDFLAHYAITYNKGAYGTGSISAGDKTEDVDFTLSTQMFTRDGYVQVGWATTDGGTKAYDLGGSYTANAAITLYPVWAPKETYVAAFEYDSENPAAPDGWTFSTNGYTNTSATAAYVGKFAAEEETTPRNKKNDTDGNPATTDDHIAFAKNNNGYAIYDLGYATTVSTLTGTFVFGSSNAQTGTIEYLGADGTTIKHTISVSHAAGHNWGKDDVNETTVVPNVRYIKVKGNSSVWIVMQAFSVTYGDLVTKYNVTFAAGEGSGSMATLKYAEDANVELPACTFTAPDEDHEFDAWVVTKTVGGASITVTDGAFTMPAEAVTVTATWKEKEVRYAITEGTPANGTVDADLAEAPAGETVTITATSATDYLFSAWDVYKTGESSVKVAVTETAGVYTFEMPAYAVTVSASFVADTRKKILYVTSNSESDTKSSDKLYAALKDDYRVAIVGPASDADQTGYDLVVLHESIGGGDNGAAAVAAAKTGNTPVLNTKSYFYNDGRWGWGTPNAGQTVKGATLNSKFKNIASHPLFSGVAMTDGFFEITDDAAAKCMQPVGSFASGKEGYTLATTPNAGEGNGCAIHELAPAQRSADAGKYLMISVSNAKLNALNANGQKLFQNAVAYLLDGTTWVPQYYTVSFDANGGEPVAPRTGNPGITLPDATNGTQSLLGWFTAAEEEGDKIGDAGDSYTPTADITLYAHWEAVSTDARLSEITFSAVGTLSPAFNSEVTSYTYTMPYGTASIPTIMGATASHAKAQDPIIGEAAAAWGSSQTVQGVAQSGDKKTYTVTMVKAPKDGLEIIGAAVTGNTTADVTGLYAGTASVKLNNKKLDDGDYYIYVTLKEGQTLQDGDVLVVDVNAKADIGTKALEICTGESNLSNGILTSVAVDDYSTGENSIVLASVPAGATSIGLKRSANLNAKINGLKVYRPMNPVLTAITIDERAGEADELVENKFNVTIPYEADLATLTVEPTIYRNAAHATTPEAVISNEGAWVFGNNTYRVMDKDGDYTDYNIVLTRDVLKHTVSFNTHGGSAVASVEVEDGETLDAAPAAPTKDEYEFLYWAETADGAEVDVTTFTINADKEFHAVWAAEPEGIKLFDGEGNLNTTNFISPAKTTITISDVEYPTLVAFGSNRDNLSGAKQADLVMYSATTNATKIKFDLYNDNGSAKTAYLWMVEEGATVPGDPIEIEIEGKTRRVTGYYTFDSNKNRSFYLTSNAKADIKVLQVKVIESGSAIPQFGQAGYSVSFNKGRLAAMANATVQFEGASIHSNADYAVLNNTDVKPKTYIQFENAVANTTVKIKRTSSNAYYVTNDLDNKGTSYTTDQEIVMSTTGTWYIGSVNSGSVAALSKIEFIAPKCEAPAFNALANSDICSGDAYVALDGTGTVSDGGSILYKWYAQGGAETVLATTATYMPEADGSYYVVALHHVDGFTDNEVTSDVVTVTTHEGTEITEGLAHVRKTAGEAATLTVEATGKDLHYAWKECETIDGTYTDVAGAADSKSLDVIVPDGIKYYKVIVSSGCGADQESIAKVEKFVPVAQVVVSTSVSWDLTACADAQIKLTETSSPKKGEECLMANIEGVHMDENFHSESLVFAGEYIYRTSSATGHPTCAEYMKFETSVPGLVRVHFAGNGDNRCLRITSSDGVQYSSVSAGTSDDLTEQFEVAAGEIELMGLNGDHTGNKKYMRFFQIEFYALDKVRDDSWIAPRELGTVCYPNGHIVIGADMYKMAGVNENGKFAFDQVDVTEPGVPYLFEATGYEPIKFYKTTAATAEEAGTSNGMVGTFVQKTLTPAEGENLYYFQGTHFYSVAERTKNLSVPAYRCYVDLNEPHPAAAPKAGVRRIVFGVNGTNSATGIESISDEGLEMKGAQKMLINGKIYILRGEKMYDATGRLVK